MNDRIRLAEAMGWMVVGGYVIPHAVAPGEAIEREIPDPFTDANDDYAVLMWVDDNWPRGSNQFLRFTELLNLAWLYQIGDYARAALKVLDSD